MRINKPATVTNAVLRAFEKLTVGEEFSGLEFKRMCVNINPALKFKYEDTFMRLLRMYKRSQFICIDRQKSKYRKVEEKK